MPPKAAPCEIPRLLPGGGEGPTAHTGQVHLALHGFASPVERPGIDHFRALDLELDDDILALDRSAHLRLTEGAGVGAAERLATLLQDKDRRSASRVRLDVRVPNSANVRAEEGCRHHYQAS